MNMIYNKNYYTGYNSDAGKIDYETNAELKKSHELIADRIIQNLHPKTVLDAGCAMGHLVTALRDRGVEAYGVDISEYAISRVREDIKPYCAVGSLTDPLPGDLPKKYDLVLSIEVLEHLSMEDGKKAIHNLCRYSDQILFSSSPSDFEDITHINVQQREYWAEIFAKEQFYDVILNRPTWVTPWAVLYSKNENVGNVIVDFERFVRQVDDKAAKSGEQEFAGRVYFNFGDGESEENSHSYFFQSGSFFKHRIAIPAGCKSIRMDPVEGYGCLIRNLNIRSDSAQLQISHCNGLRLNDLMLFKTIDPQVYFDGLNTDAHWIDVEAEVLLFDSAAWIKLYDSVVDELTFGENKSSEAAEKHKLLLAKDAELSELCRQFEEERSMQLAKSRKEQEELQAQLTESRKGQEELQAQLAKNRNEATENEKMVAELEEILEVQSQKMAELEQKCEEHRKEIQDYSNLVAHERALHQKELVDFSNLVAFERGEMEKVQNALNGVLSSRSWKITKPLRFAKRAVKGILLVPVKGLKFVKRALKLLMKTIVSLRQNGLKITLKKIKNKLTGKQEVFATPAIPEIPEIPVIPAATPVFPPSKIVRSEVTGHPVDPIQTVLVDEPVKRLNLVTDTIDADCLLGGVATALIVATEFANKWGYELRIITRNTETNPMNYENIIRISGIQKAEKVSFYSDYERFTKSIDFKMEISPDDIFFATSWWSAMAIAETTIRKRFFYIIQEVETFFYNYGGERMLCEQMMRNPNIDFIINSGYLNQYFAEHDPQIVENGCYFEPAFPTKLYSKKEFQTKERYKLFFYSRPNNPRNLYTIGVEMLKKAVEKGILDTNEWDIYCVGQNCPIISFSNGAESQNMGQLSWTEYAQFLADVDLGLCLMYTPHPSYPPFDVASSGGVVLSNKMLNKTSFDMCKNVILADLDEESFMQSFKDAVALAKNMEQRKKNYEENTIPRDWHHTLKETISYMKGKCEDV